MAKEYDNQIWLLGALTCVGLEEQKQAIDTELKKRKITKRWE